MRSIPSLCGSCLDLGDVFGFYGRADKLQSQICTINPRLIRLLLSARCLDCATSQNENYLELDQYLSLWRERVSRLTAQ